MANDYKTVRIGKHTIRKNEGQSKKGNVKKKASDNRGKERKIPPGCQIGNTTGFLANEKYVKLEELAFLQ